MCRSRSLSRDALCITRHEALDVFRRTLNLDVTEAAALLDFLTWSPAAYKGLWGAPLVPVPGTEQLAVVRSVLATSNFVRLAEIWLTRGGLDDSLSTGARGDFYESVLRQEIREELQDNANIKDWSFAADGVKKSNDFPEQIDLLLQFGQTLIVGEIKCFLFPAESMERFNYLKNVGAATRQVNRKAALLVARRDVIAASLAISLEKAEPLRIVPLVVLNQGFGSCLVIDGCTVTDAKFLKLYLGTGTPVSAAVLGRNGT